MTSRSWRSITAVAIIAIAVFAASASGLTGIATSVQADNAHHAKSRLAMATPMSGMNMMHEFDLMFIDMMIPHHQGAIAMAEVALSKGEHQEIRDLATAIIEAQQAEIDQLMAWRDAWYPGAPATTMDQMVESMNMMMQMVPGMHDMAGMMNMGMMGMMSPEAQAQVLLETQEPFDLAFINAMIPHHMMALMMAEMAMQQATEPKVLEVAEDIVVMQMEEIATMMQWRADWYGAAATPTT